jgi:hypothetical protein
MCQDLVLGYGLSRDVSEVVRGAAEAVGVGFFPTNVIQDILAVPSVLLVCDFSKRGKEELTLQYESMTELNLWDPNFKWVLLGKQALKPPKALLERALSPEPLDEQSLRVILLRQLATVRRRRQKAALYDRRLFRLLYSLKQLRIRRIVKNRHRLTLTGFPCHTTVHAGPHTAVRQD